ncbi:hypothetical protein Mgra_00009805 [Meloidogyne graminicola]|uniref:Uncharacterized protein n=1 Tax=Meloidogyne graminicola TaxID=189291 RepID=A0A8S9Z6W6_9BILA|nr:hypothetical protein Mgra_00009805 [Meloidogyne graminicola]
MTINNSIKCCEHLLASVFFLQLLVLMNLHIVLTFQKHNPLNFDSHHCGLCGIATFDRLKRNWLTFSNHI